MIFLVWLVLCYFVWSTVEILVTGSRTVSTTDDWMLLFFLLAMYWCYKGWKMRTDTHNSEKLKNSKFVVDYTVFLVV